MAADVDYWRELVAFTAQVIVIVIGWIVVHRLATSREWDKARRDMVSRSADAMTEEIDSLFSMACTYHQKDRTVSEETRIKMSLQGLSIKVCSLSDISTDDASLVLCRQDIIRLRQAITGQHFEDEHECPLMAGHEQLEVIAESAMRLKQGMVRLKHRQYRKTGRSLFS